MLSHASVVHSSPSSHSSSELHVYVQSFSHPSPASTLPSSHSSTSEGLAGRLLIMPSPHTASVQAMQSSPLS